MKNGKNMWMVRAGENAYLFDDFKNKNIIAIGWNDIGDLSNIASPGDIKKKIKQK